MRSAVDGPSSQQSRQLWAVSISAPITEKDLTLAHKVLRTWDEERQLAARDRENLATLKRRLGRKPIIEIPYIDDDVQLNKILIRLGAEDVRLRNLADDKELSASQLKDILESLERLAKLRDAGTLGPGGASSSRQNWAGTIH